MPDVLKGALSVLAYYDAFEVPLTAHEIFLAFPSATRPPFDEIERALAQALHGGRVGFAAGFYFLPGRPSLPATRHARYLLAEKKYARVRRFLSIARFTPFLRAAFVCNTLARSYARSGSDLDLFLVTAPGRIWLTRLCVTGLAALLGIRPTDTVSADRICLSFFVTSDALDLQTLSIESDVYLAHWLRELYPIYDEAGVAARLLAENVWLRDLLPHGLLQTPSTRRQVPVRLLAIKRGFERWLNILWGHRLEAWAERRQLAWLPPALKTAAASPASDVVLSDRVLKFHDHDRRVEIRDRYLKKLAEVFAVPTLASRGAHLEHHEAGLSDPSVMERRFLAEAVL